MKLLTALSAIVLATLSTASAITDADIAPAALVGKTLTFTIAYGSAPYATNGTWTGAFAASGNGFTATRITGDLVNVSTTYSAALDSGYTNVSLVKFVEGQKPATLTLYTVSGVGHYEVSISDVFGANLNGTFTIGAPVVNGPEISVQQGKNLLEDAVSKTNIGTVLVGKTVSKIFTVKNSGNRPLKNIAITIDGRNKGEFTVSNLGTTHLAANETTTFKVAFKPRTIGVRNAALHLTSNDKNESPFDIKLTGTGAGIK